MNNAIWAKSPHLVLLGKGSDELHANMHGLFLFPFILSDIDPPVDAPWWLIVTAIVGSIGTFYNVIKSTYELRIKGRQNLSLKKIEIEEEKKTGDTQRLQGEIDSLLDKIEALEKKDAENSKLISQLQILVASLSSSTIMIYGKYKNDHPEDDEGVEHILELIKKARSINVN